MIAFATRYEVSAQAASSVLTERLPAMCGSGTFTTVVSSTSMKVANMTATATIHGLTWGCGSTADGIRSQIGGTAQQVVAAASNEKRRRQSAQVCVDRRQNRILGIRRSYVIRSVR